MADDKAPYRNDHAAAIARADALERELAHARRQLATRSRTPSSPPPPAPAPYVPPRDDDRLPLAKKLEIALVGIACALPFVPMIYCSVQHGREEEAAERAAMVALAPCIERLDAEIAAQRDAMSKPFEVGQDPLLFPRPVALECTRHAALLELDHDLPKETRLLLGRWNRAELALDEPREKLAEYYRFSDWEEDGMRGARTLWKRIKPLISARDEILDLVRVKALPVLKQHAGG
jgi:hypothetical protein